MSFEDQIASLTYPCSLPPGWSVEWDTSSAGNDYDEWYHAWASLVYFCDEL